MLNLFIKLWGQALHLTPTFIIEPFFITAVQILSVPIQRFFPLFKNIS